jgi:hypothetical protein
VQRREQVVRLDVGGTSNSAPHGHVRRSGLFFSAARADLAAAAHLRVQYWRPDSEGITTNCSSQVAHRFVRRSTRGLTAVEQPMRGLHFFEQYR